MSSNRIVRWLIAAVFVFAAIFSANAQDGTPKNVKAIPGNGIVTIVWERPDTASTYRIYRSTTRGQTGSTPLASYTQPPYPILGNLPRPDDVDFIGAYGDTTAQNGTTYYYQVATVRSGAEVAKSTEVSATPVAAGREISKTRFLKLMPMGNSITCGYFALVQQPMEGGWRRVLIDSMHSNSYNFMLVGSHISDSRNMDDPYHEGWGARVVYDMYPNVRRALPAYDPDVLLLTIGTNNMQYWSDDPVPQSLDNYRELLRMIFSIKPNLCVMAAPITPLTEASKAPRVPRYNAGLKAIVDSVRATGKNINYIWELDSVTSNDIGDGVHPDFAGYCHMGRLWFRGVKRLTSATSAFSARKESDTHAAKFAPASSSASLGLYSISGAFLGKARGSDLRHIGLSQGSYVVASRHGNIVDRVSIVR